MRTPTRRFGLVSFAVALAVLVANDAWLKGLPDFPSLLSGKLSDFCGLIVAPLTLVLMFAATGLTGRLLCFAVPVLPFVAVKLNEGCADMLVGALAMTGLSWKVVSDPTDVVALAILPLAWSLARGIVPGGGRAGAEPTPPPLTSRPRVMPRLATALGAIACLASGGPPVFRSQAFLINRTGEDLEVELGRPAGRVNCAALPDFSRLSLRHDDFETSQHVLLEPNAVLPLSQDCAPVRIATTGLIAAITWSTLLPRRSLTRIASEIDLKDERGLVFVERGDDVPTLRFGPETQLLTLADASQPLPASDCAQAQQPRLEYGGDVTLTYVARITAREPVGPTCILLALSVVDADGGTGTSASADGSLDAVSDAGAAETGFDPAQRSITLCIPESELPFAVGDTITVGSSGQTYSFSLYPSGRPTINLLRVQDLAPLQITVQRAQCDYVREPCGAIWEALDVRIAGTPLTPGRRVTVPGFVFGPTGSTSSFYLLRAMNPIIGADQCDVPLRSDLRPQIELIQRLD